MLNSLDVKEANAVNEADDKVASGNDDEEFHENISGGPRGSQTGAA